MRDIRKWFAGGYLAWSLFVYFFTYGREAHDWWPVFLYPVIWPWGLLLENVIQPKVLQWLEAHTASSLSDRYMIADQIAGACYIVVGTLWFWCLGAVARGAIKRWRRRAARTSDNSVS